MRAPTRWICVLLALAGPACDDDEADPATDSAVTDSVASDAAPSVDTVTFVTDTATPTDTDDPDDADATVDLDAPGDTGAPADADATSDADVAADVVAPAACEGDEDCTWCLYDEPVASKDDCYCTACRSTPLNADVCAEYGQQHAARCPVGWDAASPCPVPRCIQLPPVACDTPTDTCVNSCDRVSCEALSCPVAEQILESGACCPRCPDAPDVCEDAAGCARCAYRRPVETVEDCYCTLCPSHPATPAQCTAWGAQWQATCAGAWADDNPCPVAICLPPEPVGCLDGACVDCDEIVCEPPACPASRQVTREGDCCATCAPEPAPCSEAETCAWCPYSRGVASPAECYCTLCSSFGVTRTQCDAWGAEWQTHCSGEWATEHPCPVAICLPTPSITCDADGDCVEGAAER